MLLVPNYLLAVERAPEVESQKVKVVAKARTWSSTRACLRKLLILVAVQLHPCNASIVEHQGIKLRIVPNRNILLFRPIHQAPRSRTRQRAWPWPLSLKTVALSFLKMSLVVNVWIARCWTLGPQHSTTSHWIATIPIFVNTMGFAQAFIIKGRHC